MNINAIETLRPQKTLWLALIASAVLLQSSICPADTIHCKSARTHKDVRIVDFRNGSLMALDRIGQRINVDWNQIAVIKVDGVDNLNLAERSLAADRMQQAQQYYQKFLAGKTRTWQRIWANARLLNLHAQAGRLEEMARNYCTLVAAVPRWAIKLTPNVTTLATHDRSAAKAIVLLREAEKAQQESLARQSVRKLRVRMEKFFGQAPTTPVKEEPQQAQPIEIPEPAAPPPQQPPPTVTPPQPTVTPPNQPYQRTAVSYGLPFDKWAAENLKVNNAQAVLSAVNEKLPTAMRGRLPQLLFWRGRVVYAQDKLRLAALDFMRVVIEFPTSEYTAAAMYYAARCLLEDGQKRPANDLLNNLLEDYAENGDQRTRNILRAARRPMQDRNDE